MGAFMKFSSDPRVQAAAMAVQEFTQRAYVAACLGLCSLGHRVFIRCFPRSRRSLELKSL